MIIPNVYYCALKAHNLISGLEWFHFGPFLLPNKMPKRPTIHRPKKAGKSHTAEQRQRRAINQAKHRQRRRLYNTGSKPWLAIRGNQLSQYPFCEDCKALGFSRVATVVDHRDGDSSNNDPKNLASLCASHHNRKTALYDGGFGRRGKNNRA